MATYGRSRSMAISLVIRAALAPIRELITTDIVDMVMASIGVSTCTYGIIVWKFMMFPFESVDLIVFNILYYHIFSLVYHHVVGFLRCIYV